MGVLDSLGSWDSSNAAGSVRCAVAGLISAGGGCVWGARASAWSAV